MKELKIMLNDQQRLSKSDVIKEVVYSQPNKPSQTLMAPVKTKRKSQHLANSNYLSEGHLTIKSRTMVEHWTENSKDLSEKIQISGGGCASRGGG